MNDKRYYCKDYAPDDMAMMIVTSDEVTICFSDPQPLVGCAEPVTTIELAEVNMPLHAGDNPTIEIVYYPNNIASRATDTDDLQTDHINYYDVEWFHLTRFDRKEDQP